MYGAVVLALAAATSALPTITKRFDAELERRGLLDENIFICPGDAPYGGCALEGNPYYVNQAKTGTVVADVFGIWECPTTYGLSNITALCCGDFSHDGDYEYSTWCDHSRTTELSTEALLGADTSKTETGSTPTTSTLSLPTGTDPELETLIEEVEDALKELDLETAEDELKEATSKFDASVLEDLLKSLTTELSLETLEEDLKKAAGEA